MPEPLQDHQPVLQLIALTDTLPKDVSWQDIRSEIKEALSKNISVFLGLPPPPPPPTFNAPQSTTSGFKFPPFKRRIDRAQHAQRVPPSRLSLEEANEFKSGLESLLDELDEPPFTIQRICELCLFPQSHYKSLGKYLRAFERSLLVTGTWEEYQAPLQAPQTSTNASSQQPIRVALNTSSSIPSTPLFSPIPFLHQDARISSSPSPPPSPLTLGPIGPSNRGRETPEPPTSDIKPLGLVDELDDPGPGHMSQHPTAITAVTTVSVEVRSLNERFIHGAQNREDEAMQTDDSVDEDKENKG